MSGIDDVLLRTMQPEFNVTRINNPSSFDAAAGKMPPSVVTTISERQQHDDQTPPCHHHVDPRLLQRQPHFREWGRAPAARKNGWPRRRLRPPFPCPPDDRDPAVVRQLRPAGHAAQIKFFKEQAARIGARYVDARAMVVDPSRFRDVDHLNKAGAIAFSPNLLTACFSKESLAQLSSALRSGAAFD